MKLSNVRSTRRQISILVVVAGTLGPASHAEQPDNPATAWTPTQVTFSPLDDSEYRLTVTGPSFVFTTRGSGPLTFRAQDEDGNPLLDGTYRYELRQRVSGEGLEAWRDEADPAKRLKIQRLLHREGRWPDPGRVQHDLFWIENGTIVAPRQQGANADDVREQPGAGEVHAHEKVPPT